MKYKIFVLVKPEILQKTEMDGYSLKTREITALELPDSFLNLDYTYNTVEEAYQDIIENKEKLKNMKLCILPVVSINWEGEFDYIITNE